MDVPDIPESFKFEISQNLSDPLPSLKLTATVAPENGWLEDQYR